VLANQNEDALPYGNFVLPTGQWYFLPMKNLSLNFLPNPESNLIFWPLAGNWRGITKNKLSAPTDNQIYGVPANQFSPSAGTTPINRTFTPPFSLAHRHPTPLLWLYHKKESTDHYS